MQINGKQIGKHLSKLKYFEQKVKVKRTTIHTQKIRAKSYTNEKVAKVSTIRQCGLFLTSFS